MSKKHDSDARRHGGQNSAEHARQMLVRIGALADTPDAMALNGMDPGKVAWAPGDESVLVNGAFSPDELIAIGAWVRRCQSETSDARRKSEHRERLHWQRERWSEALAAWRGGESQASIARRLGISRGRVSELIRTAEWYEQKSMEPPR